MKTYDFIVVGSGIAGLSFALRVAEKGSVAIVTKRDRDECNTWKAQGGIACVQGEGDSFDLHVKDTLAAGAGLCNEEVVRNIVSEGPEAIEALVSLGVNFDQDEQNEGYSLGMEGGHSQRRILHSKDTTGMEIETRLLEAVERNDNIDVLEHHFAIDLITTRR